MKNSAMQSLSRTWHVGCDVEQSHVISDIEEFLVVSDVEVSNVDFYVEQSHVVSDVEQTYVVCDEEPSNAYSARQNDRPQTGKSYSPTTHLTRADLQNTQRTQEASLQNTKQSN